MNFRNLALVSILGVCIGYTSVFAGYAIDGDLSDWGVNPAISDWIPDGNTIDYKETDGIGEYHPDLVHGYNASTYDFQAMYFDDDSAHFYVAIATRYDPIDGYEHDSNKRIGDLWIDLTDDMTIQKQYGAYGIVTGVDYAVFVGSDPLGTVVKVNDLLNESANTHFQQEHVEKKYGPSGLEDIPWDPPLVNPYYRQGSPWLCTIDPCDPANASQVLGGATIAFSSLSQTRHVIEMAIPRALFGTDSDATQIGLHITQWCGNDQDSMFATIDNGHIIIIPPPFIPAPSALILVSIGVCIAGRFRQRT